MADLPPAYEVLRKHGIRFVVNAANGEFMTNCPNPKCGGQNNFVHHDDDEVGWHCHDCSESRIVRLRPGPARAAGAAAGDGQGGAAEASCNSEQKEAAVSGAGAEGGTNDAPPDIPADTMEVIRNGVADDELRSGAFWNVLVVLKGLGFSRADADELLAAHPDGIAKKYRGRLRYEVERAYHKIKQGQHHDDAQAADYGKGEQELPTVRWHGEVDARDSRPQLIQDLIPEVGCGLISGQWGTYKTFTALDIAHSVMSREPFLGFEVVRPGGVLFIALEGQSEIALRLEGDIKEKGKFNGAHAPFAWIETCPPLTSPDALAVLTKITEQVAAKLKAKFDLPLVLIEIDTVIVAAGYTTEGADNDTALGQKVMGTLAQLAQNAHCFVFGIDHFGKDVNVGTRGSSAKEGRADVVLALLGDKSVGGVVTNTRLAVRKRRSGANGQEFAFKPRPVNMGVNSLGKEETTLVLDWSTAVAPPKTAKDDWGKTKGVKLLRKIIMSMLVDQGVSLTPWADGPTVRALKLADVKAEFLKAYYTESETETTRQKAKRTAFGRAVTAASADQRGVIVTREIEGVEYVWLASARAEAEARAVGTAGRKPADDPTPAQTPDGGASVATVPAFLTTPEKEQLRDIGCTEEYIHHVHPAEAQAFLARRRKLANVLATWSATIGCSQPRTAEQVIAAADVADDDGDKLKLALTAVAGGDHIDSSRLEQWLREISGVEVNHLSLHSDGPNENGAPLWTLKLRVERDRGSDAD